MEAVDPQPLLSHATGLLRRIGAGAGDRMLTVLPNRVEAFAISLACMLEGVVEVPVPGGVTPSELRELAVDARPLLALVDDRDAGTLVPVLEDVVERVVVAAVDRLPSEADRDPSSPWPRTRPMAYTSGTTGRRKGVHAGVHDPEWGRRVVADEHAAFDGRHGDVHLVVSPLSHSAPLRFAAVTALLGGRVAVMPRFDARGLLQALRTLRPSSVFCVPTHLHRLLATGSVRRDDLASLRLLAHAGAPCPVPLKERVLELAPEGAVWEFYGSTEGQFTVCPPDRWRRSPGTVGQARPGRRLLIRDTTTRRSLPVGTVGTVWVEAPSHAAWTYWREPERTAEAWDGDAFTVGDLGALDDDGALTLHGRQGDLVISGGVNVYPAEVERWLLRHPAVAEAAAFGVPDPDWGQRLEAAVVLWPDATTDTGALRHHCREGLAPARAPKAIAIVDRLPRTPTGKLRRGGLAETLGRR